MLISCPSLAIINPITNGISRFDLPCLASMPLSWRIARALTSSPPLRATTRSMVATVMTGPGAGRRRYAFRWRVPWRGRKSSDKDQEIAGCGGSRLRTALRLLCHKFPVRRENTGYFAHFLAPNPHPRSSQTSDLRRFSQFFSSMRTGNSHNRNRENPVPYQGSQLDQSLQRGSFRCNSRRPAGSCFAI